MKKIRNFAIIAHVDHGKSTLADRMLEITGTVEKRSIVPQYLDSNPIERERGITIKMAPVRMMYQEYILNLIDTPGHVDFSYEVNRSLAACEGVILLVDATQGVQAQTMSHYNQAKRLGLVIIPAINKVDVSGADVEGVKQQMMDTFGFEDKEISLVSGKTGIGVKDLLQRVIEDIPGPKEEAGGLRALIFNSNFDTHLGVVAWVKVISGRISANKEVALVAQKKKVLITEVGAFAPERESRELLDEGEVGYLVARTKDVSLISVGDTVAWEIETKPLEGYKKVQPMVFVGLYPVEGEKSAMLGDALAKLKLSDSALEFVPEHSVALGHGFRVGLLGLLHADIVQERIEREFDIEVIASAPSVTYEILDKRGEIVTISAAKDLPEPEVIEEIREPMLMLDVFVPETYLGGVMQLLQNHRGSMEGMEYIGKMVRMTYAMPFAELLRHFFDKLKSVSAGFATIDYEVVGFRAGDLVKMDIMIAGDKIDALAQIVPKESAVRMGKDLVEKLKEVIPRQQFEIAIQAAIGGRILARADVKSFRKDVTAKLYGGDQTRKDKLLEKQKKGKRRMKRMGKIDLPQEALLSILAVD